MLDQDVLLPTFFKTYGLETLIEAVLCRHIMTPNRVLQIYPEIQILKWYNTTTRASRDKISSDKIIKTRLIV